MQSTPISAPGIHSIQAKSFMFLERESLGFECWLCSLLVLYTWTKVSVPFSLCLLKYKMGRNLYSPCTELFFWGLRSLCKMPTCLAHSRSLINADCRSFGLRNENDSIMLLFLSTNTFDISWESQGKLLTPWTCSLTGCHLPCKIKFHYWCV